MSAARGRRKVRADAVRAGGGLDRPRVSFRPLARGDLDRVCAIEEAVFPMPWSRDSFEAEVSDTSTSFHWVAEEGGRVVAYLISWLIEDELHIGNVAVAPARQGRGIGPALFDYCLGRAAARGVARATLEVRASNERAMSLYESRGFIPVAVRRGYYCDTGEDAIVMLKAFQAGEGAE